MCYLASEFKDLCFDKKSIPEALKEMINQTFPTIQEPKLREVAP